MNVVSYDNGSIVIRQTPNAVVVSGGAQGLPGVAGQNGTDAGAWLSGTVAPDPALGSDGQIYYQTANGNVYKKDAGVWLLQFTIVGTQAPVQELVQPVLADGAMDIALPNINSALGVDVFINGVKQARSEFTVTNTALTLPVNLNLITGDTVSVFYRL